MEEKKPISQKSSSPFETISVVAGLVALTSILVSLIAFSIKGNWSSPWSWFPLSLGVLFIVLSGVLRWRVATVMIGLGSVVALPVILITKGEINKLSEMRFFLPFILALLGAAGAVVSNGVVFIRTITSKKGLIGLNVVAMIALSTVMLGIVNWFNHRHYYRIDMTRSKRFTLSSQTRNILKGLEKQLTITTLFNSNDPLFRFVKDLLDQYESQNPDKIKVVYVDPLTQRHRVQEFAKRTKEESIELGSTVFEYADRIKVVSRSDLLKYDFTPYARNQPPKFIAEEAYTSAIQDVASAKQTTIYFLVGHGEKSPEDYNRQVGLSELKKELKKNNYRVELLNFAEKNEIPSDCDVLAIIGPKNRLRPEELDWIRGFLNDVDRQPALLVCVDPVFQSRTAEETGLESLLSEYGVEVNRDVVIAEYVRGIFGGGTYQTTVPVASYPYHEITEPLKRTNTYFDLACEVSSASSSPDDTRSIETLLRSSDKSWGETQIENKKKRGFDEAEDIKGPVDFALTVAPKAPRPPSPYGPPPPEEEPEGAKLAVFGDSDWLSNNRLDPDSFFGYSPGNLALILNTLSWLAGKKTEIGIPPKTILDATVNLNPDQQKATFWICVIGIPYLGLILGGIVWWRRRR